MRQNNSRYILIVIYRGWGRKKCFSNFFWRGGRKKFPRKRVEILPFPGSNSMTQGKFPGYYLWPTSRGGWAVRGRKGWLPHSSNASPHFFNDLALLMRFSHATLLSIDLSIRENSRFRGTAFRTQIVTYHITYTEMKKALDLTEGIKNSGDEYLEEPDRFI